MNAGEMLTSLQGVPPDTEIRLEVGGDGAIHSGFLNTIKAVETENAVGVVTYAAILSTE